VSSLEQADPVPAPAPEPEQSEAPRKPDLEFLRSLGYDFDPPSEGQTIPSVRTDRIVSPQPQWPENDLYFLTVCTINHVPFTRTLIESIRAHHGDVPIVVAVVDAPSRDAVTIEGAVVLTGRDVLESDFEFFALKFDATQLCCVAKPCTIDYVLRHAPAQRIVYIDSDIYLFAPLEAMLAKLDDADFVVTPHTIAPPPFPERFWERPSLGAIAGAGVFNAGTIALRRSPDSERFIETWTSLVRAPGAFVESQGAQHEQHGFNWVSCFSDSVAVLRDTAYNVAYWNLHDRSLRYFDEGGGRWTVDRKPLVAFHFSGFTLAQPFELSRHQNRYPMFSFPAIARLRDLYWERAHANDRGELGTPYPYNQFPSGIHIDERMRALFREHELFVRAPVSPWTPEGEAHYARALLSPIPYTCSLAPVLMKEIHELRRDLVVLGEVAFDPAPLVNWMLVGGAAQHGYEALIDLHRPTVLTHDGAMLLMSVRDKHSEVFDGLRDAVHADRAELVARLANVAPEEAAAIGAGSTEYYVTSRIAAVRHFVRQRSDVRDAFPDLLFSDGPGLVHWLRESRLEQHFLPDDAIDAFESRIGGGPLARVFSFLSRTWQVMETWPLALVGERSQDLARTLFSLLRQTIELDADDAEMFLWTMDDKPWAGVPLTLELPIHTTRHPSSRSAEGQDEILEPVLGRDSRFAEELARYRAQREPVEDRTPRSQRTSTEVSVFSIIGNPRSPRAIASVPSGANVFGYFRSDIGLGQSTRGLAQALEAADCPVTRVNLGYVRLDADIRPEDFLQTYDPANGTNIFVTYPHIEDSAIRRVPDEVVEGHRNIAHLAWEQHIGTHYWRDIFAEYDQIWAVSDFAAESLSAILQRAVHTAPNVVDTTAFPPPSTKEAHAIDPRVFTFLFIYDAISSTERKNPEGAIDAFRKAFRGDDRVRLIIKASSARRQLLAKVGSDPRIEVRVEQLDRDALCGLISASDCYVSLHRGEGFGYTCAEAMAYGKPVIATAYSGNMQFMNDANSYLVRYREIEVEVPEGPFQRGSLWADPDLTHAAELMRFVYEHRDDAALRGARGRTTVETTLSPSAVGARVAALLETLTPAGAVR
jgi:glycosyltransferase involved in cell wall biosynthesis